MIFSRAFRVVIKDKLKELQQNCCEHDIKVQNRVTSHKFYLDFRARISKNKVPLQYKVHKIYSS